jgi:predicted RNA-binding protein with PIN domain
MEHLLVDGYNILHQWDELKPGRGRSLAAAREALVLALTRYHDARGGELTVVFDGRSLPPGGFPFKTGIQIRFSREGETADAVIERIVGQAPKDARFLVATDDEMERQVVEALGAHTISAQILRSMVKDELDGLDATLQKLGSQNRRFSRL